MPQPKSIKKVFDHQQETLAECVEKAMQQYFVDLNGEEPTDLFRFFLKEIEKTFLKTVMTQVKGNQSRAAKMLGINRNTLRTKLKDFDLLP